MAASAWRPRPPGPNPSIDTRKDYHAGYSDGFYGSAFGSAGIHQSESNYKIGYEHGQEDRA